MFGFARLKRNSEQMKRRYWLLTDRHVATYLLLLYKLLTHKCESQRVAILYWPEINHLFSASDWSGCEKEGKSFQSLSSDFSQSLQERFNNLWHHHNAESMSGACTIGPAEKKTTLGMSDGDFWTDQWAPTSRWLREKNSLINAVNLCLAAYRPRTVRSTVSVGRLSNWNRNAWLFTRSVSIWPAFSLLPSSSAQCFCD